MSKRYALVLIGIIILIGAMSFLVIDKGVFLDESYNDNESVLKLDILDNNNAVKVHRLKEIISENTGLEKNAIEIEMNEESLIIRFEPVELEVINNIRNAVKREYKNQLEVSSYHRKDKGSRFGDISSVDIYLIILLLVVFVTPVVIGFIVFKLLKKTQKNLVSNKALVSRVKKLEEAVEKLKKG